ncbi:uncharacterized protein LOC134275220 [Saccostrea cucullata]|uniref:uncharacterized protein LOC134275220 n=1 Tax=Saccostrea cuccullata TaxID=36930 RepID=UPI002ED1DCA0
MNVSGELRFVLRDGFCFVNGRCIADNTQDEANKCNVCKYKSDAFAWTKQSLYEECKEEAKKLWIIGVVLGCIVVLVAVTVAILMIKKKNKRMTSVKPPPYE